MIRGLFLMGVIVAVLHHTRATTCTADTGNTCEATLFVSSSCSGGNCACVNSTFVASTEGCKRSAATIEAPTVVGGDGDFEGLYSGEVEALQPITLTCVSSSGAYTGTIEYEWYKSGNVVPSEASKTLTIAGSDIADANYNHVFTCLVVLDGSDKSAQSSPGFTVRGFTDNFATLPEVMGMPANFVANDVDVLLTCGNLPVTSVPVTIAWKTSTIAASGTDASGGAPANSKVTIDKANMVAGQAQNCKATLTTLKYASTASTEGTSPDVSTPASASTALPVSEAVIVAVPASYLTGGYVAMKCLVRAETLTGLAYSWLKDGKVLVGQEDNVLQINELASAGNDGVYKCKAATSTTTDGYKESATETITVAAITSSSAAITGTVSAYGEGTVYPLTCKCTGCEQPGMTYEWTVGGTVSTLSTTNTLSYTATSTSVSITCKAKLGSSSSQASNPSTDIQGAKIASVAISGPSRPIIGQAAKYSCVVVKGATTGTETYVWSVKGGTTVAGETGSTYTISSVAAADHDGELKCAVTADSETKEGTLSLTGVSAAEQPAVSGTNFEIKPSGSYSMTCESNQETEGATYKWTFGSTTLSTTGKTHTISNAASTDAGDYKCKITVGTAAESAESAARTTTWVATQGLACTAISTCSTAGEAYSGNCIASICECDSSATLTADGCSTGSSGQAVASVLLMLVGLIATRLF